jgi:hypothetical protein
MANKCCNIFSGDHPLQLSVRTDVSGTSCSSSSSESMRGVTKIHRYLYQCAEVYINTKLFNPSNPSVVICPSYLNS